MSVRFILGRAGTGKTYYCLNAIREELKRSQAGDPLILLVPEQATFEMNLALLRAGDLPGYSRAYVLSFRNLAHHVFNEVGGDPLPLAGNVAKQMIIARVLEQNKDKLRIFNRSAQKPGMAAKLASSITELHRYRCAPEQIEAGIASLEERGGKDSVLYLKLADILLVYNAYHDWLAKHYCDPDDFLDTLADKLPQCRFADRAHVWIDGFAEFTPQEYHALEKLMERSSEFEVALCLDPAGLDSLSRPPAAAGDLDAIRLFHRTEETYRTVRSMARRLGQSVETLALPRGGQETRFTGRPALAHIERELFSISPRPFKARPEEAELVEAADRRAEVDAAARQILHLCKEKNYRYRDIAVIVRDFKDYDELISACFAHYRIPYFIDRRRPVTHHPLIELVRSVVRAAAEDWPIEHVIQYLKTDLAPVRREEADALENYALEHGIEGSRWYDGKKWRYRRTRDIEDQSPQREDVPTTEEISRMRDAGTKALRRFHKRVGKKPTTGKQITEALFKLLQELEVAGKIETWRKDSEKAGDLDAAAEHAQMWNDLIALFDELVGVLGEEKMAIGEYAEVLDAGLSGMTLGLVPPAIDQLLVGSIDRSRHPDLRAALVIGVGEGVLPKVRAEDPMFTDRERRQLSRGGLRLAPTSEEQLYHERFLGYIALTRPKDCLWVSYPASDSSGKKLNPSLFVTHLKQCLPGLEPRRIAAMESREKLEAIWTKPQLASAVALAFRRGSDGPRARGDKEWRQAYNEILAGPKEPSKEAQRVLSSLLYSNSAQKLPSAIIQRIYKDKTMIGSASQFETFRACPFRYFAQYVLRLDLRREFRLSALDIGSLCHAVLRRVLDGVLQEGIDLRSLPSEEAEKRVDCAVEELAPKLKSEILLSDGRSEYIKNDSRRVLRDMVAVMVMQAKATDFRPAACELSFGASDDPLPAVEFDVGGRFKVRIRGRIDRVDTAEFEGSELVRVVDYKSTGRQVPLHEIVTGLHLQLPTYLIALKERGQIKFGKKLIPAGGFLQPINPAPSRTEAPGAETPPLSQQPEKYKPRGFFAEEFISVFDRSAESGRFSDYLSLFIKNNGELGHIGITDVLREDQLPRILELAERHIKDIAEHVIGGEIPITPYRMGGETPCSTCDYNGLCRFDATINKYREIEKVSRVELTEKLSGDVDAIWREVSQHK